MRSAAGLIGAVSLLALGAAAAAGGTTQRRQPAVAHPLPLCRRAAPMPPLGPERDTTQTGSNFSARGRSYAPGAPGAPPAPPPPPPPPLVAPPPVSAPPAPPADIAVTGSRIAEAPAAESAFSPREPSQGPRPRAGLLTAGEHDDLLNPELYRRYVDGFLMDETLAGVPRVDTGRVLTIAVNDGAGRPVPFARVTLTCADGNTLTLSTVASGEAAFFPGLDRLGRAVRVDVAVPGGARAAGRTVAIAGGAGAMRQTVTLPGAAAAVRRLDLAVVIDCTGSMTDELNYLQAELRAIVARLVGRHPGLDVRIALVAYRDTGDVFVTRTFPFTRDIAAFQSHLAAQSADGGGDTPEAVEQAFARVAALPWRPDAVKSLLFVADAPPHADDVAASWRAAEALRAQRVQIVPVAASGVDRGAEYIMRAMAAATQSRYLFLTDDSGIGNPHAPPAIDCYLVTRLDQAIGRVIDGQLSGRRIEPAPADVIRTVGRYDAGRCLLPRGFAAQRRDGPVTSVP